MNQKSVGSDLCQRDEQSSDRGDDNDSNENEWDVLRPESNLHDSITMLSTLITDVCLRLHLFPTKTQWS